VVVMVVVVVVVAVAAAVCVCVCGWAQISSSYSSDILQPSRNKHQTQTPIFEGARWAVDFGAASYGLPGYWDKSTAHGHRYSYYKKSTSGSNTLTFNNNGDFMPGWCAQ
jgi:hypothetical protein